jgi:hypothetical protein
MVALPHGFKRFQTLSSRSIIFRLAEKGEKTPGPGVKGKSRDPTGNGVIIPQIPLKEATRPY